MITGNNLAGVWAFGDGWRIAFPELYHAGLIEASKALKDHSVTDKGCALGFGSTGPTWSCERSMISPINDAWADTLSPSQKSRMVTPPHEPSRGLFVAAKPALFDSQIKESKM